MIELEVHESAFETYNACYHEQKTITLPSGEYRIYGANYPRRGTRHFNVYLTLIQPIYNYTYED
jgi:hypothetical protein